MQGRETAQVERNRKPVDERFEALVTGRVQGVCFRHFTRLRAHQLGLRGWVRNEPDGAVRVVAEGPRADLEQLLDFLRTGPDMARVDRVTFDWQPCRGDLAAFTVAR